MDLYIPAQQQIAYLLSTQQINGYFYRCIVSGTCVPQDTTDSAILNVNVVQSISAQPSNITVCKDDRLVFNVSTIGTNLSYQWQFSPNGTSFINCTNGSIYTGVFTNSLTVTNTVGLDGYFYRCIISGPCSSQLNSFNAQLTVNSLPLINNRPLDTSICSSQSASFIFYFMKQV